MSIPELRAYLLSHRTDDEAFDKLVDRLEAILCGSVLYPVPGTAENIAIIEAAIRAHVQRLEEKH